MGKPRHTGDRPELELKRILTVARAAALAVGANDHEADEVAQTTAVKLWSKWQTEHIRRARRRGRERWEGYVRRAARNVHYDLVRSHQRRIDRQHRAANLACASIESLRLGLAVPASPEQIEAHLGRSMIAEEIMRLPTRQRQVAARICLEEMTVSEVALDLNIQPQSVRKHLRRARRTLQVRLSEFDDHGRG